MKRTTITTRKLVMTAMLAALVAASSAIRIEVPADITGTSSFHLGNILCALSGILLGPWLGGLAAGLGSALFDVFDPLYISECWLTFLTKAVYGLFAGAIAWQGRKAWCGSFGKAFLGAVAGAVGYGLIYLAKTFFYSGLLIQGLQPAAAWLAVITKVPATVFNAVVAIIGAPILAMAIYKALDKAHLKID